MIVFLEHLQRCSVCDPAKIFFTSKFSYLLFCNPTYKTETGTANRWGWTTIANHKVESLWWTNQKHWAAVRSYLLHSFVQLHSIGWLVGSPFTGHGKAYNYAEQKPFSWSKPACFDFSSSNFTVQGDILSTPGDALTQLHIHFQNNFDYFSRKATEDVAG